jgi:hypothetical protein
MADDCDYSSSLPLDNIRSSLFNFSVIVNQLRPFEPCNLAASENLEQSPASPRAFTTRLQVCSSHNPASAGSSSNSPYLKPDRPGEALLWHDGNKSKRRWRYAQLTKNILACQQTMILALIV